MAGQVILPLEGKTIDAVDISSNAPSGALVPVVSLVLICYNSANYQDQVSGSYHTQFSHQYQSNNGQNETLEVVSNFGGNSNHIQHYSNAIPVASDPVRIYFLQLF